MFLVDAKKFGGQPVSAPSGSKRVDMPSLNLIAFDPLPVIRVEDEHGDVIGAFLGTVIDPETGNTFQDKVTLPSLKERNIDEYIEREIYRRTGSFLFILDRPDARRLYLDACGSLSAVWDPETGRAGAISSQLVTQTEVSSRFDAELYNALRVDRDGWFPAGLTAHHGIRRLMPNHYLDLDAKAAIRHWPRQALSITKDPEATCGRILDGVRATLNGLAKKAPLSVALTAGNETRMIVAASHQPPGDLEYVTVSADGAELDLYRAKELAALFNLPHRIISLKLADAQGQQDWQDRAGWAIGGPHIQTHPTIQQLRNRPYFVGGLGGEIGRAFFWRQADTDDTQITPEGLWARIGMPSHPRGVAVVAEWLDALRRDLGDLPSLLVLDLAYLEIRMGCWGFALSYTKSQPTDIHPLISRDSFSAMLSLPPEWRRMKKGTNLMIQSVIRQGWAELLELPISRYGDWRDMANTLRRIGKQPHLVAKKLRKALR